VAVPAAQETPEATALPAPQEAEEPVAVPAAQAKGTPIPYVYMSGDQNEIRINGEIESMTVAELLDNIKSQEGIEDMYCNLVVEKNTYYENDTSLLKDVVVDIQNIGDGKLMVIKIHNYEKARELVGDNNFLGSEVWQELLRLPAEESEEIVLPEIVLPPLSDVMLAEIRRLLALNQQPILVLDLGKSIQEIENLCRAQDINVFSRNAEKLRAEAFYSACGPAAPRWLLLPGSDEGVLPGSRNKNYADQVKYMGANYPPGYKVGDARELVTLAMLKYREDDTVLFGANPTTWARCKERYQTGSWKDSIVILGSRSSSASGGLVVYPVPGSACDYGGLFCVLCVVPSPGTKKP
jgi:hypothetical protein